MMPVLISFDFIEAENYLRTHLVSGMEEAVLIYMEAIRNLLAI